MRIGDDRPTLRPIQPPLLFLMLHRQLIEGRGHVGGRSVLPFKFHGTFMTSTSHDDCRNLQSKGWNEEQTCEI